MKKSAQLHASNKQNFACRRFFEVNGISIVFSGEEMLKRGRVSLKRFNYKSFIKSFIKVHKSSIKAL